MLDLSLRTPSALIRGFRLYSVAAGGADSLYGVSAYVTLVYPYISRQVCRSGTWESWVTTIENNNEREGLEDVYLGS